MKKIIIGLLTIFLLFHTSIERVFSSSIVGLVDEIFILLLFTYSILYSIKKNKISTISIKILLLTLLFAFTGIISCYLNSSFITSKVLLSSFLSTKFFIMIISLSCLEISKEDVNFIIEVLEKCTLFVIIIAVVNFLIPSFYIKLCPFAIVTRRFGLVAVTSLFYHAGRYGWFMLFMSIFHYSRYINFKEKSDFNKMVIYGLFSILSWRTKVIMSLAIIFLFELIRTRKISFKKIALTITVLILFYVCFGSIINETYKLYFTDEYGVSARQALKDASYKIAKDYYPLGVGFGKYGSWYARVYYSEYYYKYNLNHIYGLTPSDPGFATDVFWPSILGETGIIGITLYVYILFILFKKMIKFYNKTKDKQVKTYVLFSSLSLIQSLCESLGEPSFNSPPQNIFLGLFIGISLSFLHYYKGEVKEK